ncbi:class I SAM-dependent methyltransferase [Acidisphaera rubrifaciens]
MTLRNDVRPMVQLDADAIRDAYRRWAGIYDATFGAVSMWGRRRTVGLVNRLPGRHVLEVGVGTGLALPLYDGAKQVTGIDLSAEMLAQARRKVRARGLSHVCALEEMDAEAMDFADGSFDVAAAMFVASVVPHPRRLVAELKRVVRPGGHILFVNHFSASGGVRLMAERALAPAARALGWHPDFRVDELLAQPDADRAVLRPVPPFGLFTLVHLPR